ncbi:DUF1629 domain-containing protein [uncultured Roseibium sp.]|uniref:imm11 family protein n=1 Tax=uncultured Roseibium sp. TaxID=1936171 RepID=UPI0026069573|nr:DUF1629 domain-containing protein [uncultured Roseibium sp.]
MAWRVSVDIKEFPKKFDYRPDQSGQMGDIEQTEPKLTPDQVPSRVTISGKVSECALFVMAFGGGQWIVSQRFRDLVEALEPNVHNWLPTDLFWSNGQPLPEPYYFLQPGQSLDTVIFERSFFTSGVSTTGEHYVVFPVTSHLMTFDKRKINGKHLWKEYYAGYQDTFFSDELVNELKKIRFKKCFELLECREEVGNDG